MLCCFHCRPTILLGKLASLKSHQEPINASFRAITHLKILWSPYCSQKNYLTTADKWQTSPTKTSSKLLLLHWSIAPQDHDTPHRAHQKAKWALRLRVIMGPLLNISGHIYVSVQICRWCYVTTWVEASRMCMADGICRTYKQTAPEQSIHKDTSCRRC